MNGVPGPEKVNFFLVKHRIILGNAEHNSLHKKVVYKTVSPYTAKMAAKNLRSISEILTFFI